MDRFFSLLALLLLLSCDSSDSGSSQARAVPSESGIKVYANKGAFPVCSETTQDTMVYSKEDGAIFICDGLAYSKSGDGLSPEELQYNGLAAACPTAVEAIPDPVGLNGQLALDLGTDVDPCQVSGYVVGQQTSQKIELTQSGEYFVNNVPPGEHDIIITAGTLQIATGLTETKADVGLRLNGVNSITGVANRLGKIKLQKFGSVSGQATLNANVSDYAGILVYIPGTEYSAYTDVDGKFAMSKIPPGIHKLYFEKDGFQRGQVGAVQVDSEANTETPLVTLGLSTNVSGTYLVTNAFKTSSGSSVIPGQTAEMLMLPSSSSVLMMIKDADSEGLWAPIRTNYTLELDIGKYYSLYKGNSPALTSPLSTSFIGKYADANGLESDLIVKNYYFDIFAGDGSYFKPSFSAAINSQPMQINLTNIVIPPRAERMAVFYQAPNTWGIGDLQFSNLAEQKTIPLSRSLKNCGAHQVGIVFDAFQGKVRSPQSDIFNSWASFNQTLYHKCYTDTIASGAPAVRKSTESWKKYYKAVWTGTRVLVFGYDTDNNFVGGSFDPQANSWSAVSVTGAAAPITPVRYNFELEYVQGKVFLFGGTNASNSNVNSLHIYDVASNSWISPGTDPLTAGNSDVNTPPTYAANFMEWHYAGFATDGRYAAFFPGSPIGVYDSNSNTWDYPLVYQLYDTQVAVGNNAWIGPKFVTGQTTVREFLSVALNNKALIVGGNEYVGNIPHNGSFHLDLINATVSSASAFPVNAVMKKPYNSPSYYKAVDSNDTDKVNFFYSTGDSHSALKYSIANNSWTALNTGTDNAYMSSSPIIHNNQLFYVSNLNLNIVNLATGDKANGLFGQYSYDASAPTLWPVEHPNIVLPLPSLQKLFLWGGARSYYGSTSIQYVDYSGGILLNLDYPDQWTQ